MADVGTQAAPDTRATSLRVRAATIEVTGGPNAGRLVRIDRPTFVIGTGDTADLRLSDPTVSREHVRLALTPAGVHVRDPGSKNGTWVGGMKILDAMLTVDATLTLGTTSLALRLEDASLDLPLSERTSFGDAIGVSAPMRHLFALLERAAPSSITVLLEGESGVGKEVLARALHAGSTRAEAPFVAVDCGAIPGGVIESELFGHARGAFTGAVEARRGLFEQASGGTVFLDEVGELPLELQPKLLRVLEQREIRPVGSTTPRPIDVRVVAATNRCLAEASERGEFRRDLYYRLAVARIAIPPLRDRPDDILPLARAFLRAAVRDDAAELPEQLAGMLLAYAWPGNVRELRNAVDRYVVLGVRDPAALLGRAPGATDAPSFDLSHLPFQEARREFERRYTTSVLARAGGVVTRAAELAEVARPSFYRMLERQRDASDVDEATTIPPPRSTER